MSRSEIQTIISKVENLIEEHKPSDNKPIMTDYDDWVEQDYNNRCRVGDDIYQEIWFEGYSSGCHTYDTIFTRELNELKDSLEQIRMNKKV